MEFEEECAERTKKIIDKTINVLLEMIPLIYTSETLKNVLMNKTNEVFNYFLEKFEMTFSQLGCILWMMSKLNEELLSIFFLQDIITFTILSYLFASFIISFKYMFHHSVSIKLFSYFINPHLGQLLANEQTILKVFGYNLYITEEQFNEYKSIFLYLFFI
jgi:hypothetical protein